MEKCNHDWRTEWNDGFVSRQLCEKCGYSRYINMPKKKFIERDKIYPLKVRRSIFDILKTKLDLI